MKNTRDTVTYELKQGRNVVYRGTTNNPAVREAAHRAEGKNFDRLVPTSRRMTQDGAKAKEKQSLETYRRNHGGKNPRYNRDSDG